MYLVMSVTRRFAVSGGGRIKGVRVTLQDGSILEASLLRQSPRANGSEALTASERAAIESLEADLQSYFRGEKVDFSRHSLALEGTEFQKSVWEAMRKIPYGETRPYKWIAEKIGKPKAVRAVGNACGRNPSLSCSHATGLSHPMGRWAASPAGSISSVSCSGSREQESPEGDHPLPPIPRRKVHLSGQVPPSGRTPTS